MTAGGFRSTLFPETGPAVAQFPVLSQTDLLPVAAVDVSTPAATLVESENAASAELTSPEPESVAVQASETFALCHSASAVAQATVGRGTLYLFGPEILFRAQPHGTFKFLFNGIHLAKAGAQAPARQASQ